MYLQALLSDDGETCRSFEEAAQARGYGPRAPCNFATEPRKQRTKCGPYIPLFSAVTETVCTEDHWHRYPNGELRRGTLVASQKCSVKFTIFTPKPKDRQQCPYVVITSTNPHNHPPPVRSKLPLLHRDALTSTLLKLDWRLAYATPRKVLQDSAFISNLSSLLGWKQPVSPVLSDLHPSLGNHDKARQLISHLRKSLFPGGTDWGGKLDSCMYSRTSPEG